MVAMTKAKTLKAAKGYSVRPATLDDLKPIVGIYNWAVNQTFATIDSEPLSGEEAQAWWDARQAVVPARRDRRHGRRRLGPPAAMEAAGLRRCGVPGVCGPGAPRPGNRRRAAARADQGGPRPRLPDDRCERRQGQSRRPGTFHETGIRGRRHDPKRLAQVRSL